MKDSFEKETLNFHISHIQHRTSQNESCHMSTSDVTHTYRAFLTTLLRCWCIWLWRNWVSQKSPIFFVKITQFAVKRTIYIFMKRAQLSVKKPPYSLPKCYYVWLWHLNSHKSPMFCAKALSFVKRAPYSVKRALCTLHHTATHCNTPQHNATRCNTLQHAATSCNTLQHEREANIQHHRTDCNLLQHTATHCNTLQHTATHCNTLQHTATHCNTL